MWFHVSVIYSFLSLSSVPSCGQTISLIPSLVDGHLDLFPVFAVIPTLSLITLSKT